MHLQKFTFNPFSENTFLLWNEDLNAIIIDPGMSDRAEQQQMEAFIQAHNLTLTSLILTHAHIDHILGNAWVFDRFGLKPVMHYDALQTLLQGSAVSSMYGIPYDVSPQPSSFLNEGDVITLGASEWRVLLVPGHAPGHIALYNEEEGCVIAGDVLFRGSVGRVDLPGSEPRLLVDSIQRKMYALPDDTVVYCGHGPETTIGFEKANNPFVRPNFSGLG
ncbi:MAG: hypothetical protein RL226_480 [Bacteroidota bacterium]